jgi:hypothetical protein
VDRPRVKGRTGAQQCCRQATQRTRDLHLHRHDLTGTLYMAPGVTELQSPFSNEASRCSVVVVQITMEKVRLAKQETAQWRRDRSCGDPPGMVLQAGPCKLSSWLEMRLRVRIRKPASPASQTGNKETSRRATGRSKYRGDGWRWFSRCRWCRAVDMIRSC